MTRTLGPEAACTSGTPDFFTAILLPLLNKETSRLCYWCLPSRSCSPWAVQSRGLPPPPLTPGWGVSHPDLPRVPPVHASLLLAAWPSAAPSLLRALPPEASPDGLLLCSLTGLGAPALHSVLPLCCNVQLSLRSRGSWQAGGRVSLCHHHTPETLLEAG